MEQKSLCEILRERAESKGLNIERLTKLTSIPERYLEGLINGDFSKLPPAPYIRGYLMKLTPILDLNFKELWEEYKKEERIKSSGPSDKLPSNRFAIKTISKKTIFTLFLGILLIIYLGWNIGHLLGRPKLDIINPISQTTVTTESAIKLLGYTDPSDKLLINNEEVALKNNGLFEKNYDLQLGLNTIEFSVKRFLGKETKVVKQIIYQIEKENDK